jgi:hypothetical protein
MCPYGDRWAVRPYHERQWPHFCAPCEKEATQASIVGPVIVASISAQDLVPPMPRSAAAAALETFAAISSQRRPGLRLLPLRFVGADGAVVAAAAGQIVWPFAAPEDRHAVLDWGAGVAALDDDGVDGAAEDPLAVADR